MARTPKPPTYRRRRGTKGVFYAVIRVNGKELSLGRYGSPESYAGFERIVSEWRQAQLKARQAEIPSQTSFLTVADLVARFMAHAEQKYRRADGSPSPEVACFAASFRPLAKHHGHTLVKDFGPLALKAVRQKMLEMDWSRTEINRRVSRIRMMFKWGESEELIPASTYHALQTVSGLRIGEAREGQPVLPVPESVLAVTLPLLPTVVKAIAEFQLLTAARPGEVLTLRVRDIDRSGKVEFAPGFVVETGATIWSVRLERHKNAHRGQQRILLIGPKAQAVIAPLLLGKGPDEYIFSPQESMAHWYAEKRRNRKTKVQPSQFDRRRPVATKLPGPHYTPNSYCRAVKYAIEKANRAAACETCQKVKAAERCAACKAKVIPSWHPYQLRHNAATRLVQQFGWDIARMVLGHRQISTTQIYALDDIKKAAEAMSKAG